MFSPRVEEDKIPAHSRGKRRSRTVEGQESSIAALVSLLTKMREEMKRRDE